MGMLSKPKAPAAPDPMTTATQAQGLSQGNATWNANQYMANAGKSGPAGSVSFGPNGQTQSFSGGLQNSWDSLAGNFGQRVDGMGAGVNFDATTPQNILNAGMTSYDALTAPAIGQGQNRISQAIANRGLPVNDVISRDMQADFDRQNAVARQNAFSTLYGQLPGMQATMTDTAIKQGMAPGMLAGQDLGLMGAQQGLLPSYNAPFQFNAADPANAYTGTVNNNYQQAMAKYKADSESFNKMIGAGVSLAAAPFTGGASLAGLGGLFNNSGGSPSGGSSLPWYGSPTFNNFGSTFAA